MKLMKQTVDRLSGGTENDALELLGKVLAVPYGKGEYDLAKTKKVIESCVKKGHTSVLEHVVVSLDCLTNIETYKDFTRHRVGVAFTIESTSFVKYDDFPVIIAGEMDDTTETFIHHCESMYAREHNPKTGRDFIPQCMAARMIMTCNLREWRYVVGLRSDPNDNPLTIELRNLMFHNLHRWSPFFFPVDNQDTEYPAMRIKQLWK